MVISLLKKTHMAMYFLTLLQFTSSAEQVLLLGVFGSSTNVCVSWDVRSEKAQPKEITCVSMVSMPRGFSKGETLWEAGGEKRQRNILPGSQDNLACSPRTHVPTGKGQFSIGIRADPRDFPGDPVATTPKLPIPQVWFLIRELHPTCT